jgi:hypothetical protein
VSQSSTIISSNAKVGPGRKEADHWPRAREALIAEIKHRGPYQPDVPDWKSKADYDRYMVEYIEDTFGIPLNPISSNVKRHRQKALKSLTAPEQD